MMMAVGIVENQAIHKLNVIKSKMMKNLYRRHAIEVEVSKLIRMMMVVGIVENQAIHRLNVIKSKMMKKEGRDSKIIMPQPVKTVIKMVHLWCNMKQQQWLNVHKDAIKSLCGM